MNNELSVVPRNEAAKLIHTHQRTLAQLLGSSVDAKPFLTSAIAEVNGMDSKKPCSKLSVMQAVFNCGSMGLHFGKQRGHAYLVPFRVGKGEPARYEAQLIVGYRGFTELAFRSGWLASLHTDVVCMKEEIKMWTDEHGPHFRHETNPFGRDFQAASIQGAYCVWRTSNGGEGFKFIDAKTIQKAKKDTDPWRYSYDEMAMKTAIRRASKLWRMTPDLANAVSLDEQAERDESQAQLMEIPRDIADEAQRIEERTQDDFLDVDSEERDAVSV